MRELTGVTSFSPSSISGVAVGDAVAVGVGSLGIGTCASRKGAASDTPSATAVPRARARFTIVFSTKFASRGRDHYFTPLC